MDIKQYIDSTYLKLPSQSGLTEAETLNEVTKLIEEAIKEEYYAVMIRPEYVSLARKMVDQANSSVKVGTVIGFHEGNMPISDKLEEAKKALKDGADELDFVINYKAYINKDKELVKTEFISGTRLVLDAGKLVKWIIEIAALDEGQIADICKDLSRWAQEEFKDLDKIFVKSSTGFYKTEGGKSNGATYEGIKIMLNNSDKLPVKASGGVKTHQDAINFIEMGVKRLGTSAAKSLL